MKCENCKREHKGSYGSGRFCSVMCARSFSAKYNNKLRIEKIRKSVKEQFHFIPIETRKIMTKNGLAALKRKREILYKEGCWKNLPISYKRKKVLEEQQGKCAICGINQWQGKQIVLHFDHIDGNKQNTTRENVRFICPNCHSQTETYCGNKRRICSSDG